jgi:hypothetical protein
MPHVKKCKNPLESRGQILHSSTSLSLTEGCSLDVSVMQAKPCASKRRNLKKDVDLNLNAFTVRPPSPQQEATFGSLRVHFSCDNTAYRINQTLHLVNPAIMIAGSTKVENANTFITGVFTRN